MIVCVCHAVCDRRLQTLAADGHQTLEAIAAACGAGGDCGACQSQIELIIEEAALVRTARSSGHSAPEPTGQSAPAIKVRTAA